MSMKVEITCPIDNDTFIGKTIEEAEEWWRLNHLVHSGWMLAQVKVGIQE